MLGWLVNVCLLQVQQLFLTSNKLSEIGAMPLLQALKHTTAVRRLKISGNHIKLESSGEYYAKWVKILKKLNCLPQAKYLHLQIEENNLPKKLVCKHNRQ